MVIISRASAERICGVLTEESTIREADEPITTVADGSIDFDHVSFRYSEHSERPVLDDIDLHIRSGQTIGIVGGTGSAKTSLVQLIPRLYDVSSGALKVGGVDVRDYELEALRDEVAMVLQKNVLFAGTIAEICAGAIRTRPTRRFAMHANSRRPTDSSRNSPTSTTRTSSRAARMSPAASGSACASRAHCSRSRRS